MNTTLTFRFPSRVLTRYRTNSKRSITGDIALTTNEYNTAKRLRKDYWLYVVLHCGTPSPSLNILHDPATLDWQPIVKIEHYRLRQDSVTSGWCRSSSESHTILPTVICSPS